MEVKDNGKDFEPIPTGVRQAVCSAIHDLGMQPGYKGKAQHKLVIIWELDAVHKEGEFIGQRFITWKMYTSSLNEQANLSKDLEAWRGKVFTQEQRDGFELDVLLNVNCNLNMVQSEKRPDGRTFVNVNGITGLHKGQNKMVPEQPGYVPAWIAALMVGDVTGNKNSGTSPDDFDDDIPF